eukprot:1640717-Alexandrium_andersonii.AAC.1
MESREFRPETVMALQQNREGLKQRWRPGESLVEHALKTRVRAAPLVFTGRQEGEITGLNTG